MALALSPARVGVLPAYVPLAGTRVLYLGLAGVLHPCPALYKLVFDKSCWDAGHRPYESVPVLQRVLDSWQDVSTVLMSRQMGSEGLEHMLAALGPSLARRVIGNTFSDPHMDPNQSNADAVREHVHRSNTEQGAVVETNLGTGLLQSVASAWS